jgi:hypothetical protein
VSRLALLAPALLLSLAATAHADRGEITDQTPYTLEPHHVRIGVSDVSMGLFGHDLLRRVEVGTRPIAWVPSLLGLPSYDVHAKFELWRDSTLSLAVAAEHLRVDLSSLIDNDTMDSGRDASFSVTPLEGWAGLRLGDRVRLNAGAVYTNVAVRGTTPAGPIDSLGGAVGSSNLQLRGNLDVKVTRSLHVIATGRYVPWQEQWAEAGGSETTDDGGEVSNTTRGEDDLMNVGGRAWSAGAEVHLTGKHVNLRLGLEYGHYALPIVNFVVNERGYMPTLDLYWRI